MQRTQKNASKKRQAGFSFVELAVVVLAVGMVAAMSLSAGMTQMKILEVTSTQAKLEQIRDALNAYHKIQGRYPCPTQEYVADYGTPNSYKMPSNFGSEAKNCASTDYVGIVKYGHAVIGSIPYKDLKINPDLAVDPWGNRITYAIDLRHTMHSSSGLGMIEIIDSSNNPILQSPIKGKAIFALISHGANGNGAYPSNSITRNACANTAKDAENCNDNDLFLDDRTKDDTTSTAFNDDYILWHSQDSYAMKSEQNSQKVDMVSAAEKSTCVTKKDGSLWCMGNNSMQQLGSGKTDTNLVIPTQVIGGGKWKKISKHAYNTCGIKDDSTLWCWGMNMLGAVGDGTTVNKTTPVLVSGGGTWKDVSSGAMHTCAIKSDDTLWCWGNSSHGQIGDGTSITRTTPRQIVSGTTWKMIDAGYHHTCAIKSDDTLWCWGYNVNGQLGTGDTSKRNVPTQISGGGSWKQVSTNVTQGCGIKLNDTLWCWGENASGQLGNGTNTDSYTPTEVSGGGTWSQIATGTDHTCGIKTDNRLWCWGRDSIMALGDIKNAMQQVIPVEVYGNADWKQVSLGESHSCAIKMNDTLWCWGNNLFGQLGYGFWYYNSYNPLDPNTLKTAVFGTPYPVKFK